MDSILLDLINSVQESPYTPNFNLSQGSVMYTLLRAQASALYNQLITLENNKRLILGRGEGEDLDIQFELLGITRKQGITAKGYALISSLEDTNIPKGSILTNPTTGNQYYTKGDTKLISIGESLVEIESTEVGEKYNIPEGSLLIYPNNYNVTAIVGKGRTRDGLPFEGLTGGIDVESDSEYIARAAKTFTTAGNSSKTAILNILKGDGLVNRAVDELIRPGVVVIWVDSNTKLNNSQINYLTEKINPFIPLGSIVSIKQATRTPINLTLQLSNQLDTSTLRGEVNNYLNSLRYKERFNPSMLSRYLSNKIGTSILTVTPISYVEIPSESIFYLNALTLNLNA